MLNYNRASPTISRCFFGGNDARAGGGMANGTESNPQIDNSVFVRCTATTKGGAMSNYIVSTVLLTNCTIVSNSANIAFGGIVSWNDGSRATVVSSILWGNSDPGGGGEAAQLWVIGEGSVGATYSSIHGWTGTYDGEGNTDDDPEFVDLNAGDFRLLSISPVINAGDPRLRFEPGERDLDGHPRILCDRVDMGAYEFGIGDFTCNREVDLNDYASWMDCMTGPDGGPHADGCEAFDFDADSDVDLQDFAGMQGLLGGS